MTIRSLLVANRGEIACRIFETCTREGIRSVAVFSDADRGARHVRRADHSVHIGLSESGDSYLSIERIISAAKQSGADAIHPGYGFLSENAAFARAVASAGLRFVGPPPDVIEKLGDKIEAKRIAETASVPTAPYLLLATGPERARLVEEFAARASLPLLVKAAHGGGGRGMRVIRSIGDLADAVASASREALAFFNDGTVFVESLIEGARHIEVQIIGDFHGNVMHLWDRDCTTQRSHQKVIEEAPASALPQAVRSNILDAAVRIGKAVGYVGAGTVEFLVRGEEFFFLEVNSRLQVEHPVTEFITGIDLVSLQLHIAANGSLTDRFPTLRPPSSPGCAIECRICAESPWEGFSPSTGQLIELDLPAAPWIRVDTGFERGDRVTHHYDSLIAKLIVRGDTREEAISRTVSALDASHVAGLKTNLGFLRDILSSDAFRTVAHTTAWATSLLPSGEELSRRAHRAAVVALYASAAGAREESPASSWDNGDGFRLSGTVSTQLHCSVLGVPVKTKISIDAKGVSSESCHVSKDDRTGGVLRGSLNGAPFTARFSSRGRKGWLSSSFGHFEIVAHHEPLRLSEANDRAGETLRSPLPGKIIKVLCASGSAVEPGDPLFVLESMKMEHQIRATVAGTVQEILVVEGVSVAADQPLASTGPAQDQTVVERGN